MKDRTITLVYDSRTVQAFERGRPLRIAGSLSEKPVRRYRLQGRSDVAGNVSGAGTFDGNPMLWVG